MESLRLSIRVVQARDVDATVQLWTNPLVTEHIGGPRDADIVRKSFRRLAENPDAAFAEDGDRWWSVCLLDSGEWIGLCGLLAKDIEGTPEVDLSYFFLPDAWGHGYATEAAARLAEHAFIELSLPSLTAVIDPANARSAKVAARLGMTLEKTIPRPGGHIRQVFRLNSPEPARMEPQHTA